MKSRRPNKSQRGFPGISFIFTLGSQNENLNLNVISRQRINEFINEHKDAESSLTAWFKTARKARWEHLADLKGDYPNADLAGELTAFNIKRNDLVSTMDRNALTVNTLERALKHYPGELKYASSGLAELAADT